MFRDKSAWLCDENRAVRISFLAPEEKMRAVVCGQGVGDLSRTLSERYSFPPGEIEVAAYKMHDYATPALCQTGFFMPGFRGILVIGKRRIVTLEEESLNITAEKGHFRAANLTDAPISVKRNSGMTVFDSLAPGEVSRYRLAGMGEYHLPLYRNDRKTGEISFAVKEGSVGTLILLSEAPFYLAERSIGV